MAGRSDQRLGRHYEDGRRLIVDVSVLYKRDAGTGIQRVVRNVWSELIDCAGSVEIIAVFADRGGRFHVVRSDFLALPARDREVDRPPYVARKGDIFLGLDFSPVLLPRASRAIVSWKRLGIPIHLVVYDLLPLTQSVWFTYRGARNYRRWLSFLENYADSALCISNNVAEELRAQIDRRRWQRFWRKPTTVDVKVIALGKDFKATEAVAPPELAAVSDRPIILMVGTIEPRKGYDFALRVFDQLWRRADLDPVVVIVGKAGWKTAKLQRMLAEHPRAGESLYWLQDVDDGILAWLYSNSAVLFSASQAEGFGLPLVEARSQNLSVIATDLPVFREVSEGGVDFFDAGNTGQAVGLLVRALNERWSGQVKTPTPTPAQTWRDTAKDILSKIMP
jgi:glycosyltransferase involved in cell wall biosynthesis